MPEDPPMDRRRFFRQGLAHLIKPIASAIGPMERVAKKLGEMERRTDPPPAAPPSRRFNLSDHWLRPPGAIAEKQFLQTCSRGGECVKACPAQCIKIDTSGAQGGGAPFIQVDQAACVVCDGLYCMQVCRSGALVPTSINDIDMGTAVWREDLCARSAGRECTICVDQCPLGEVAIKLQDGQIAVQPLGCIGCGICQQFCPTSPKSIFVIPKAAKEIP